MTTIAAIKAVVAGEFSVPAMEMISRRQGYARPRQIAMSLARDLTPCSYPQIGRAFGNKDHSTVMHAVQVVAKLRRESESFEASYQSLILRLAAA